MRKDNPTILIVDDEPVNRIILARAFTNNEYNIFECGSGDEVLAFIDKRIPDIILLDIMMPGMDGFEVCQKIKNNPRTFDVPILLITALNDKQSKLKGLELGAYDVITKPFDIFEVKLRVKQYLRMRDLFIQVKENNLRMKREILSARKVQMNLLPDNHINFHKNYEFLFEYFPCEDLGGDFIDFLEVDENHFLFYIADVSGHGVASSLVTVFLKEFFNQHISKIKAHYSPKIILETINKAILSLNFSDKYLTMFLGILNIETNQLYWSSAGPNTFPLLITEHDIIELKNQAPALGWWEDINFDDFTTDILPNSLLLCYSDAAVEIKNKQDEMLGIEGIVEMVKKLRLLEYPDFQSLIHELLDYSNQLSFDDDLTLIGIRRLLNE